MDYALPPDARQWQATARAFTRDVLGPLEPQLPVAEGPLPAPAAIAEQRRQLGLWGLTVPADHGGQDLSWLARALVSEELHHSLLGLWPHQVMAAGEPPTPLYAAAEFLRPCLDGSRVAHQVRVRAGSLPQGLLVRPTNQGVVLDGDLTHVPGFAVADLMVLVVDQGQSATAYLCDAGQPGLAVRRRTPTMGAVELVDLMFSDCEIPAGRIMPDVGEAAGYWQAGVRLTVLAAGAVGAAHHCLEHAIAYARARHTFGRPLADRQAIQWMLADSARELHAARLLVYQAAARADRGDDPARPAAWAKVYATDVATRIVDRVMQIHGGSGYSRDLPWEHFWRDLRYYRLAEGDNRELTGDFAADLVALLNS